MRLLAVAEAALPYLCGLWAFGLGLRFLIEFAYSDGWLHVPKNGWNVYFDFLPLCALGALTVLVTAQGIVGRRLQKHEC
jgi:hypothetical protein